MAVTLGKRKRNVGASSLSESKADGDAQLQDDEATRALFRRAFEAKFAALEPPPAQSTTTSESDEERDELDSRRIMAAEEKDSSEHSEWDGLSEEDVETVQVVDHAQVKIAADNTDLAKSQRKSFMSSKPPRSDAMAIKPTRLPVAARDDEDGTEAANLKNDLALQRLLKESHLLDPTASQRAAFSTEGKGRLKALDMRLQDLGAKSSVLQQEKMPMALRKGITSKKNKRETARRQDAAENGIILERVKSGVKSQKPRQRGIGGPAIGKFQRGMLKLSSRDVKDIVGAKPTSSSRKGRVRF